MHYISTSVYAHLSKCSAGDDKRRQIIAGTIAHLGDILGRLPVPLGTERERLAFPGKGASPVRQSVNALIRSSDIRIPPLVSAWKLVFVHILFAFTQRERADFVNAPGQPAFNFKRCSRTMNNTQNMNERSQGPVPSMHCALIHQGAA